MIGRAQLAEVMYAAAPVESLSTVKVWFDLLPHERGWWAEMADAALACMGPEMANLQFHAETNRDALTRVEADRQRSYHWEDRHGAAALELEAVRSERDRLREQLAAHAHCAAKDAAIAGWRQQTIEARQTIVKLDKRVRMLRRRETTYVWRLTPPSTKSVR